MGITKGNLININSVSAVDSLSHIEFGSTKTFKSSAPTEGSGVNQNNNGFYVKAVANRTATGEDQLDLNVNALFYILQTFDSGWWFGLNENGNDGWMPSNYLQRCTVDEVEEIKQQQKQQTNIGDLLEDEMDNYLANVDKYLSIMLPARIVPPTIATPESTSNDGESDEDLYVKITTKGNKKKEDDAILKNGRQIEKQKENLM